ncbi:cell division protein FtsK [Kribbella sp. CA-293567]|uniref:cell division protein FtsK n=1 Tax=Kribbella sp. CA-293567 TaxID=3002436 RepID=UPI0022DDDDF5|nr:cell division protein FtsK [Kribbella sp. CA-293567]WBQ02542.1 cell division protein FtsK [Kribbella sp. CA-293567]
MPNHPEPPGRLAAALVGRRATLRAAALSAGAAVLLAGCKDDPAQPGPGATGTAGGGTKGPDGATQPEPSTDPAVVAAISTAAGQAAQAAQRLTAASKAYPALSAQLTTAAKYHAQHLAKLNELSGVAPAAVGKLPALPKSSAAALADLAGREQKLSVAHAAAAAKLSGVPARLLAMVAASEIQLASFLTVKKEAGR